ncbi:MAG: lipopolysaccharide biosynthesis protein [Pseudomonadota bacterium]
MTMAAPNRSDGTVSRILKNMGLLFGGKTSAVLIGLVVLGIAARALTVEELGSLLLLHAFVALVTGVASFKSWQALIQYGTRPSKDGDLPRFQRLLRFTIGLDLLAALVAAILSVSAFLVIRTTLGLPDSVFGLALVHCLVSAANLRSTPLGVLRLHDRFDLISLYDQVVPFVRLVGAIAGVLIGGGLGWFIGVWAVAAAATNIVMPALALRELRRRGEDKGLFSAAPTLKAPEEGIWRFVWMSNIDATISLFDKQMPTMLSGVLLGPAFAALFKIARDISDVFAKAARLLNQVLYPELVRLMTDGDSARSVRIILYTSLSLLAVGSGVAVLIRIFGPALFSVALEPAYQGVAPIATLLVVAAALMGAAAPVYSGLYALGRPGRAVLARAVTVALTLMSFVILANTFGPSGPGRAMVLGAALGLVVTSAIAMSQMSNVRSAQTPPS